MSGPWLFTDEIEAHLGVTKDTVHAGVDRGQGHTRPQDRAVLEVPSQRGR